MKITKVKRIFSGHNLYAKVETDEGVSGIGEGTLNSREAAVERVLAALEPVLAGQDPFRIEHIWQDIYRGSFWRGGPVLLAALSAVDAALWDIKGKALGTPVYNLLGGACRDKIRMYCHVGGDSPKALCENAEAALRQGFTALRVCPHDNLEGDHYEPGVQVRKSVRYMRALRDAVGEEVEIIFEVHTRLSPVRAVELCNAIAETRPLFVEDPLRADSPESYRTLRAHTHVPLGTGEKLGGPWDYKTLLEEDLIDYVRADVCNCGGITSLRKIAAYAETHYVELIPHGIPSPAGMMAVLHADLAIPNFCMQENGLFAPGADPALQVDARMEDGFTILGTAPGLGIELDESKCAPYTSYEHPHWRREDGTVQDW